MSARVMEVATATRGGSGKSNQDRLITAHGALAVLDGASSEKAHEHDGGWYAEQLAGSVGRSLRWPVGGQGIPALLSAAILEVAGRMGDDRPSSTIGLARWGRVHLEVLVLGDITIVVFLTTGDVDIVTDDRLDAVAPQLRAAYKDHLRAGHGFDGQHSANLAALQAAQLAKRNVAGGYWIAEADPAAVDHAISRRIPMERVSAVLAVTDGIAKGITQYGLFDWEGARKTLSEKGPEELIDQICRAEDGDPDGRRWPRGKRHDDKTLAFVSFRSW